MFYVFDRKHTVQCLLCSWIHGCVRVCEVVADIQAHIMCFSANIMPLLSQFSLCFSFHQFSFIHFALIASVLIVHALNRELVWRTTSEEGQWHFRNVARKLTLKHTSAQ